MSSIETCLILSKHILLNRMSVLYKVEIKIIYSKYIENNKHHVVCFVRSLMLRAA